jgi:hypothetical protein
MISDNFPIPKVDRVGGVHLEDEIVETTTLISKFRGRCLPSLVERHHTANGNGDKALLPRAEGGHLGLAILPSDKFLCRCRRSVKVAI